LSIVGEKPDNPTIYSEMHHIETNQLGLVSLILGEGKEKIGDFTDIDLRSGKYFLKVETDAAGGTNFTDIGTIQILVISLTEIPTISKKTSSSVTEDEMFISRKYAGKFLDYRQTGPKSENGPNIIWIKTSMENTFGKISAYGKKCNFSVGDNLYLKRTFYNPGGLMGYWVYRIENDASVYYKLTELQHDRKVKAEVWFK